MLTESDLEGVQRVINGSYAYIIVSLFHLNELICLKQIHFKGRSHLEFAIMEDFLQSGECRLSLAKENFYKRNFAFPVPKGSPLPALFNKK